MNFDPLVARHYFFNNQFSPSHNNNAEKKNSDDVTSFVSLIKTASPILKKKIMISSDKPEYEKEEPNDVNQKKLKKENKLSKRRGRGMEGKGRERMKGKGNGRLGKWKERKGRDGRGWEGRWYEVYSSFDQIKSFILGKKV